MTKTLFPQKRPVILPVKGRNEGFPVNRIFCVGRNYMAHAAEMGISIDKSQQEPFYFLKHPQNYVPSGDSIPYPPRTENFHHEMELVVAIGKEGHNIPQEKAKEYIFAYGCGLDMTRRDLQLNARDKGLPWDIGKDFEKSAVLSELIEINETGELTEGVIELRVNGETRQSADLNQMIWNVAEIIEHLSTLYTLEPGDIILTGTPEGVSAVLPGDLLEGSIEGAGTISLKIEP